MARKATKKNTGAAASRSPAKADSGARESGDRLLGAVYHNGRMYDHRKPADQQAFKQAVAEDKKLGDKNKKGEARAQIDLQRLADEGIIKGYGTKASAKGKRAADRAEEELDDQEQDPSALAGGGVDAVEQQDAMEEEVEEQEEDR
jgi:hypothetical protein